MKEAEGNKCHSEPAVVWATVEVRKTTCNEGS